MYKDLKVTQGEVASNNVKSAPDRLRGTATENKNIFDKLVELFVAKYNALLDQLDDNAYIAIDPITIEGYTISHADSGITQGKYGSDEDQYPQDGGTFIVPYFITDSHGHLVSAGEREVTLPADTGDKHYTYEQSVASDTWTVAHNLDKYPTINVFDSAGTEVFGNVEYVDLNNVVLTFSGAFSGKAIFN